MQKIFDFFLDWKVKLGILAFVLLSAFAWHKVQVKEAVENATTVATIETRQRVQNYYETRIKKAKEDADKAQSDLKASFDTQTKEKDAKHKSAIAKYDRLVNSLSNRPPRPESSGSKYGLSVSPGTEQSFGFMDGSGLSRLDAQLLARFALRTEGLKNELLACYSQYDTARETLDKFKEAHKQP